MKPCWKFFVHPFIIREIIVVYSQAFLSLEWLQKALLESTLVANAQCHGVMDQAVTNLFT